MCVVIIYLLLSVGKRVQNGGDRRVFCFLVRWRLCVRSKLEMLCAVAEFLVGSSRDRAAV